jgi:hypothetical protein
MIQPDQLRPPACFNKSARENASSGFPHAHYLGLAPCQFATAKDLLCIDWIATHAQWSARSGARGGERIFRLTRMCLDFLR